MTNGLDSVVNGDTISPLARLANVGSGLWNWGGPMGLPSLHDLITGNVTQPTGTISAANAPQIPDAPDPIRPSPVTTQMTPFIRGSPGTQSGFAVSDPNALPNVKPGTPLSANTAGIPGLPGAQSGSAPYGQPDRPYPPFQRSYGQPDRPYPPFQGKLPDPKPKTLPPPAPPITTVASKPGEPGAKPIDSSDWGKPDEQTQAVNKALDIIANMKVPTLEKLHDLPRPPTRETQNSWMSTVLSSAGLFLAMMGSRRSAAPMTAALKSFGGYLQGYNEGQQIVWKQKETEYQDQLNYAIKQNELELEQYKADLEANKDKLDMLHESLYATSLLNEDKKIQMELENGHIEIALKMMQARNEALKQVREQAMNVIYGKIYAGLPVTKEDIAALTAEPDMGSLTTGSSEHSTPNNVGNLRAKGGGPGWQTFDTPQDGAAAMIRLLRSYGPMSLGDAIRKYAPPTENDTNAYIQRVSQALKMDPNAPMPVDDPEAMAHIAYVMATVGEGSHVQPEVFSEGTKIAYQPGTVDGKTQEVDGKPQQVDGKPQPQAETGATEQPTGPPGAVAGYSAEDIASLGRQYYETGQMPSAATAGGGKEGQMMSMVLRRAITQYATWMDQQVEGVLKSGVTGPEALTKIASVNPDLAAVVQTALRGDLNLGTMGGQRSGYTRRIVELATRVDKDFSQNRYQIKEANKKAFDIGKQGDAVTALQTLTGHLNDLLEAGNALGNTNYTDVNTLKNFIAAHFGKEAVGNYERTLGYVADETERVWRGSGGNYGEIKRQTDLLSSSSSPAQIRGQIRTIAKMVMDRANALSKQATRSFFEDTPVEALIGTDTLAQYNHLMAGSEPQTGDGSALPPGWSVKEGQ